MARRKRKGLTQAEYAKLLGVTRQMVAKDRRAGRLVLYDDGSINPEASLELRRRLLDPTRGGRRGGPAGRDTDPTLAELRCELLRLDVALKELELSKRRAEVVDRDKARRAMIEIATAIREHVLAWSARVAPELAAALGVEDVHRVEAELDKRLRDHLAELGPDEPRL